GTTARCLDRHLLRRLRLRQDLLLRPPGHAGARRRREGDARRGVAETAQPVYGPQDRKPSPRLRRRPGATARGRGGVRRPSAATPGTGSRAALAAKTRRPTAAAPAARGEEANPGGPPAALHRSAARAARPRSARPDPVRPVDGE